MVVKIHIVVFSGLSPCSLVGYYQNLLSFHPLFKNIAIRIYKTIILPVVLYGCWKLGL
jgi:hypothetical protein